MPIVQREPYIPVDTNWLSPLSFIKAKIKKINEYCQKANGLPSFVGKSGSEMRGMICDAKFEAKSKANDECTKKAAVAAGMDEDKETEKAFEACKA